MFSIFSGKVPFADLPFHTDVHSHLLPGVDDGFKDVERTRKALKTLSGMGVKRVVMTPHIFPELYPDNNASYLREKFDGLKDDISSFGVELKLAGEHMVYSGFEDVIADRESLLMLTEDKLLIEMSYAFESPNIEDVIFRLNKMQITPVLAHPERYNYYQLRDIEKVVSQNCLLQLNIMSLGGYYGTTVMKKAVSILERGLYSYAGTDMHGLTHIEVLKEMKISRKHQTIVERLFLHNEELF